MKLLLTGATGYVGGRLAPRLIEAGHTVRCVTRDPARLLRRPWGTFEVMAGDISNDDDLDRALVDQEVAYYLVHAMKAGEHGFAERDRQYAQAFARAAARSKTLRCIVYLGALGDSQSNLSPHLASRQEVGDILRESGVPVAEFRAAIIVGSGSASFEMIRYLGEQLPVMITPKWVNTRCQPIAIRDVLRYLTSVLDHHDAWGRIIEIGGSTVLTYREMMMRYAEARSLRRRILAIPILSPRLSSLWVGLVTPVPASIARPLIEGLRSEVVVRSPDARRIFDFEPLDYDTAVRLAIARTDGHELESSWFDALFYGTEMRNQTLVSTEGMIVETRTSDSAAPLSACFRVVSGMGGEAGWPYADWLWELRGLLDRLIGGPGIRRGRRSPTDLRTGDALDFWRVEEYRPNELIRLRAEMKLPGRGWLQYEFQSLDHGGCRIIQKAFFEPHGLLGRAYWFALFPFHYFIFDGMVARLARNAQRQWESKGRNSATVKEHDR